MKSRELAIGGLLTAFAIIIPLAFGGVLGIVIPPFSATLASHVPILLAMLVSPFAAVMVGLGSALGFFIKLGPVIAARASMHAVFGYLGAKLVQRKVPFRRVLLLMAPLHALLEALVIIPFVGFSAYRFFYVVGFGTLMHHLIDSAITLGIVFSLRPVLGRVLENFSQTGEKI